MAVRALFRQVLERRAGALVVGEASDGRQAINIVAANKPDVLFLDLAMPVLDGLGAIPELRRCSPETGIVLLSGFDTSSLESAMKASGADGFIQKDLPPDVFARRITAACQWAVEDIDTPVLPTDELTAFAWLAVHDLQGPLQLISGFTSLFEDAYSEAVGEVGREYLRWIIDSAAQMDAVVSDLMAYATVSASEAVMEVDLNETLRSVLVELRPALDARRAVLTADTLPVVTGDPAQLRVVLRHLIDNAITFVADGVIPAVHLSSVPADGDWFVSVLDNGLGIDPAASTSVIDGLRRLNSKPNYPGASLRLAICRRILDRHGGTIAIERRPSGGSCAYFTLPMCAL